MTDRTGIFGASGSGKTSVLYHELKATKITRVVVFDPIGEAAEWRGFTRVDSFTEFERDFLSNGLELIVAERNAEPLDLPCLEEIVKVFLAVLYGPEPLDEKSPLWDLPNVYISAHSSVAVDRYMEDVFEFFFENLQLYLQGDALANVQSDRGSNAPRIDEEWGEPDLTPAQKICGWNSFEVLAMTTGDPEKPVNAIPPRAIAR